MTTHRNNNSQAENNLSQKALLLFYILALSATVFVLIFLRGSSLLENLGRFNANAIYVAASAWDIPILVSIPTFLAIIAAMLLKLFKRETEKRIQRCVHIALVFALVAILLRLPFGFIVSQQLGKQGYTRCLPYSSAAIMSPTVWVRDARYCVENSGSVRKQLLHWLDQQQSASHYLSPQEVKTKVAELLTEFDRLERERYPGLYD